MSMPPPYTLLRHTDVPARSFLNDTEKFEGWFYRQPLEMEQGGLSIMKLAPGVTSPPHKHKTQEEVFIVISGELEMKLGDEIVKLGKFDAVRVAAATARAVRGAGESGGVVIAFSAPYSENLMDDVVPVADFWA